MHKWQGFSLLELLIAFTVIGALGAIAYPAYQNFSRRLWYAELLKNTEIIKTSVEECYKTHKTFSDCDSGKLRIAEKNPANDKIDSLVVKDGVITIVPKETQGILHSDNYVLTPAIIDGEVQWTSSGKAIDNAYAS